MESCASFASADTMPFRKVNPVAVHVMEERGIGVSRNRSKLVTQKMLDGADRVVTM